MLYIKSAEGRNPSFISKKNNFIPIIIIHKNFLDQVVEE
jgi:hypothetical protein